MFRITVLATLLLSGACTLWQKPDYLLMVETDSGCGYLRPDGSPGLAARYQMCFTDTFRTMAFVADPQHGLIGINRAGEILFEVFAYDNGPDPAAEGLFRILQNGKIGYASEDGEVIIKPQFSCAWPFEKGRAKVALKCEKVSDGEHWLWQSVEWFFIDKTGKEIQ